LSAEQISRALEHFLFAEGERLARRQKEEALEYGSDLEQRTRPHPFRVLLKAIFPIAVTRGFALGQIVHYFLNFTIPHDAPKSDGRGILEGDHDFCAAGFDLEQIISLNRASGCPAADLFNNSD